MRECNNSLNSIGFGATPVELKARQMSAAKESTTVTEADFIPMPRRLCLDQFLKLTSVAESGGQAKVMIQSGKVKVNGETETRRRRKLVAEDVVEVGGRKWPVKDSVSCDFSQ